MQWLARSSVLAGSIPGVDTVNNAVTFTNGTDPQTDAQYKVGFPGFLQSLSKATPAAIEFAVQSVGEDVDFTFVENQTLAGVFRPVFSSSSHTMALVARPQFLNRRR